MKKLSLLTIFIILFSANFCFAQRDTIFLNNKTIVCSIKEITEDSVRYTYPDEDLVNSVYKNSVQKIVLKSGRTQVFSESTSFKPVRTIDDFQNVTITQIESEVKGLFKIGDVSSKAKGTTALSNQERVKERAYNKLKAEAAMMGANIVYLTHQRTEGNKAGGYFQASSSAETNLSGVAYSNVILNFNDFQSMIQNNRNFTTSEQAKLWSSDSNFSKSKYQKSFTINKITNVNGSIMIEGDLQGISKYKTFKVVSFDENSFNVFYEDKSTAYNIKILL